MRGRRVRLLAESAVIDKEAFQRLVEHTRGGHERFCKYVWITIGQQAEARVDLFLIHESIRFGGIQWLRPRFAFP